jgi:hypothetical protein
MLSFGFALDLSRMSRPFVDLQSEIALRRAESAGLKYFGLLPAWPDLSGIVLKIKPV